MDHITHYCSPLGRMTLVSNGKELTGLWFERQKYSSIAQDSIAHDKDDLPVFQETIRWLNTYFRGEIPDFTPPIRMYGTVFRQMVWEILLTIPYGQTTTYGEVARRVAHEKKVPVMSAQAVGGAVGHNDIALIIPCHRVVGQNGSLTGYAAGLDKKAYLLKMEKDSLERLVKE